MNLTDFPGNFSSGTPRSEDDITDFYSVVNNNNHQTPSHHHHHNAGNSRQQTKGVPQNFLSSAEDDDLSDIVTPTPGFEHSTPIRRGPVPNSHHTTHM